MVVKIKSKNKNTNKNTINININTEKKKRKRKKKSSSKKGDELAVLNKSKPNTTIINNYISHPPTSQVPTQILTNPVKAMLNERETQTNRIEYFNNPNPISNPSQFSFSNQTELSDLNSTSDRAINDEYLRDKRLTKFLNPYQASNTVKQNTVI